MRTQAIEDYLKSIYTAQGKGGEIVTTSALAERLGVALPSVTNMLKKMAGLGLVVHYPYQGVTLTETGHQVALQIIRRHCLVELYLAQKLGVPWDQAHSQAESWEHVLSEELVGRIEAALGYPTTDLYGIPIPIAE